MSLFFLDWVQCEYLLLTWSHLWSLIPHRSSAVCHRCQVRFTRISHCWGKKLYSGVSIQCLNCLYQQQYSSWRRWRSLWCTFIASNSKIDKLRLLFAISPDLHQSRYIRLWHSLRIPWIKNKLSEKIRDISIFQLLTQIYLSNTQWSE